MWYQDTYKHSKLRLALLRPSAYIRLSHLHVSLPSLSDRCFRVSSMPARLSKVWRRLRMAVTSCLRPSHAVEEICPKNHPTSPPRSSKHKVHTEGEDGSHTLVASSPRDSAVPPKDLLLPDTPHVDLLNPARQPRLLTPPLPSRSERAYVNVHSLHLGDIRPYGSTGELWEPHESVLANPTSMITNLECASFAGSSRNCELHVGGIRTTRAPVTMQSSNDTPRAAKSVRFDCLAEPSVPSARPYHTLTSHQSSLRLRCHADLNNEISHSPYDTPIESQFFQQLASTDLPSMKYDTGLPNRFKVPTKRRDLCNGDVTLHPTVGIQSQTESRRAKLAA